MEKRRSRKRRRGQLYDGREAEVQYYNSVTKKKLRESAVCSSRRLKMRESDILRFSSTNKKNIFRNAISPKKFEEKILKRMQRAEEKKSENLKRLKIEAEKKKMREVKKIQKNSNKADKFLKRMEEDITNKRSDTREFKNEKKIRQEKIQKEKEEMKNCTFTPNYNKKREQRKSSSKRLVEKLLNWKQENRRLKINLKQRVDKETEEKIKSTKFISSTGGSARLMDSPESKWQELTKCDNMTPKIENLKTVKKKSWRSSERLNTEERFKVASSRPKFKGKRYLTKPPVYKHERKFQNGASRNMTRGYVSKCSLAYLSSHKVEGRSRSGSFDPRRSYDRYGSFDKLRHLRRSVEAKVRKLNLEVGQFSPLRKSLTKRTSRSHSKISSRKKKIIKQRIKEKKRKLKFKKSKNKDEKRKKKRKKRRAIKYVRPKNLTEKKPLKDDEHDPDFRNYKFKTENNKKNEEKAENNNFETHSFVLSSDDESFINHKENPINQGISEKKKELLRKIRIMKKSKNEDIRRQHQNDENSGSRAPGNSLQRPEIITEKKIRKKQSSPLRNSLNRMRNSIISRSVKSRKGRTSRKSLKRLKQSFEKNLKKKPNSQDESQKEEK